MKLYIGTVAKEMDWQVYVVDTGPGKTIKPSFLDPGILTQGVGMLPPRLDLMNSGGDGFAWGYGGGGPAQLAVALIAHATGSDKIAKEWYHQFLLDVVMRLNKEEPWAMSDGVVRAVVWSLKSDFQAATDQD